MTAEVGTTVVHRRYVSYAEAHYAGNLVDGAWGLGLFGDVATEMCIRTDGDEGLFASYSDVQFRAPVRAGDVVEARATLTRVGRRSREMAFELLVVARGDAPAAARSRRPAILAEPIVATTATGTVVVPPSERGPIRSGPRPACPARHAENVKILKPVVHPGVMGLTCGFAAPRVSSTRVDTGGPHRAKVCELLRAERQSHARRMRFRAISPRWLRHRTWRVEHSGLDGRTRGE